MERGRWTGLMRLRGGEEGGRGGDGRDDLTARFLARSLLWDRVEPLSTVLVAPSFHTALVFRGVSFSLPGGEGGFEAGGSLLGRRTLVTNHPKLQLTLTISRRRCPE